jgi:dTDP-4-dehydrorhamnose 3,5-epimerase
MLGDTNVEDFRVSTTTIDGLVMISARAVSEERGRVRELFRLGVYRDAVPGMPAAWAQVNLSRTNRGAVRGLHGETMSKLVTVASGRVFGVFVDTRAESATKGRVFTANFTVGTEVFVPAGVCNGFQAIEDETEYLYFFDDEWRPDMDGVAITPLDTELGVQWPIELDPNNRSQISAKDAQAPTLASVIETISRPKM